MKLTWNLLLITMSLLLPTTTVLAEPAKSEQSRYLVETEVFTTAAETSSETDEEIDEEIDEEKKEAEITPEERARLEKFIKADELYLSGDSVAASKIYRSLKEPFPAERERLVENRPKANYDPAKLSPKGRVYWRISGEGLEQNLESKILVPLQFLVEQEPEFIPGYLRYARALKDYDRPEDALQVLEQGASLYSNEPDLLRAAIETYGEQQKWVEASVMARQFALLNPDHPQASEFNQLADENIETYQSHLRSELTGNAIANAITGTLGFVVTGGLLGPFSTIQTTALLLKGESGAGESVSNQVKEQLPMLEDEEVLAYVREIGNKLTEFAGRDFDYEFHIIMDDRLNAFALPGGKIFINAGAIMEIDSEAELAGLLAHEISHAVLSHGFQLATEGNLTANLTQFIPFGGAVANLIVLDYSRDMERQADVLGTRILVASGYAADGLRNLAVALNEQDLPAPPQWLSTHPHTEERIGYLENLIVRNGYNRYTYEGVSKHSKIKKKVVQLVKEYKESEDYQLRNKIND